jgi:hypothetical protein
VTASTKGLTLPGYVIGQPGPASSTVTFTNFGSKPARVTAVSAPTAPFTLSGLPRVGATIAPGASVKVKVTFASTTPGSFSRVLSITTNSPASAARSVVNLSAVAATAPQLDVNPQSLSLAFGSASAPVAVGGSDVESVSITNSGGSALIVSSVATSGPFELLNSPPANDVVMPASTVTLPVLYLPASSGTSAGSLVISAKGLAPATVTLTGFASGSGYSIASPGAGGWIYGGAATVAGSAVTLTPAQQSEVGSAFWSTPVTSGAFTVSFTARSDEGTGGDGMALVLADTSALGSPPYSAPVGGAGSLLGYGGVAGLAVAVGEYQDPGAPSAQWVGIADGVDSADGGLSFVGNPVALNGNTQDTDWRVTVTLEHSTLEVWVGGTQLISQAVTVPASFLLGFSGATGGFTNVHEVSGVSIEAAGAPPS